METLVLQGTVLLIGGEVDGLWESGLSGQEAPLTGFGRGDGTQNRRQEQLWVEVGPGLRRGVLDSDSQGHQGRHCHCPPGPGFTFCILALRHTAQASGIPGPQCLRGHLVPRG